MNSYANLKPYEKCPGTQELDQHRSTRGTTRATGQKAQAKDNQNNEDRKLKAGDEVKVIRGRNQGVRAMIIRETAAQYKLRLDQVVHSFRKWKNNVKKFKAKK